MNIKQILLCALIVCCSTGCAERTKSMWRSMPPAEEYVDLRVPYPVESMRQEGESMSLAFTYLGQLSHLNAEIAELDDLSTFDSDSYYCRFIPDDQLSDQPNFGQTGRLVLSVSSRQGDYKSETYSGRAIVSDAGSLPMKDKILQHPESLWYRNQEFIQRSKGGQFVRRAGRVIATPAMLGVDVIADTAKGILIGLFIPVIITTGYGAW